VADLDQFGRSDWIDRLCNDAERLIEATSDLGTEAQGERGTRLIHQIADGFEAERAQSRHGLSIQPQRRQRQRAQHGLGAARRDDRDLPAEEAGRGMGGALCVRDRRARLDT
jgi:hypothetical protein